MSYSLKEADVLLALANPIRLRMMRYIISKGETSVTALGRDLGIVQATASQHLKVLREAGMIHSRRVSTRIYYSVAHDQAIAVVHALDKIFGYFKVTNI